MGKRLKIDYILYMNCESRIEILTTISKFPDNPTKFNN